MFTYLRSAFSGRGDDDNDRDHYYAPSRVTRDFALTEAINHVFYAEALLKKNGRFYLDHPLVGSSGIDGMFQSHTTLARLWNSIAMQLKDYPEGFSPFEEE